MYLSKTSIFLLASIQFAVKTHKMCFWACFFFFFIVFVQDIHLCPNLYKHSADNGIHMQASCSIPVYIYSVYIRALKADITPALFSRETKHSVRGMPAVVGKKRERERKTERKAARALEILAAEKRRSSVEMLSIA